MNCPYSFLKGKSKNEIVEKLGKGSNSFISHLWTFKIYENWIFKSSSLYIYFDGEIAIHIIFKRSFKFFLSKKYKF